MEYSEKVIEHYTNPRNVGKIENASGIGEVGNPVCGDIMKMFIKVENNIITDVKFKTFGCGAAGATSSISTEMIKGKTVEEALKLSNKDVVKELGGLPPVKSGAYLINDEMIDRLINKPVLEHASNLGAIISYEISRLNSSSFLS